MPPTPGHSPKGNTLTDNNTCRAVVHLTTPDLARRWGMSVGHIQNLRSAGIGPSYVKIGSRVLYSLAVIEAYEAARTIESIA